MELARKLGFDVIEVMWEDDMRARAEEVRNLLKEFGIKPSAMTIYPQRDLDEFKRDIAVAEPIGCPVYSGHPAPLTFGDREGITAFRKF